MPLAALTVSLALSGPTGLQALHSPQAEQSTQEMIVERLRSRDPPDRPSPHRRVDPDDPAGKRAAAWRADHLTCTSRRGRTPDQYQRECGAWLAEEAARGAGR